MGKPMKVFVDGLRHADAELGGLVRDRIANAYAKGFFAALDRIGRAGLLVDPQSEEAKAFNALITEMLDEIESEAKEATDEP